MRLHLKELSIAATVLFASAAAQVRSAEPRNDEAHIHFANLGGINDWHADSDDGLFVQGRNKQWYYAKLFGPCDGLPFATAIGFVTEPSGTFDRFSSILVNHKECHVVSFVKSNPPPKK